MSADSSSADRAPAPAGDPPIVFHRPLRDSLRGDLLWVRPELFRRGFQLTAGSEVIAAIHRRGWLRARAVAESADGRWILERRGWRRAAVVREAEGTAETARFEARWLGGGTLRFASGPEYRWTRSGLWRPQWAWAPPGGSPVIAFRRVLSLRGGCEMEVQPQALPLAELPVLVVTGAYLTLVAPHRARAH